MAKNALLVTASEIASAIGIATASFYIYRHFFILAYSSDITRILSAEQYLTKYSDIFFIIFFYFYLTISIVLSILNTKNDYYINFFSKNNKTNLISNPKTVWFKICKTLNGDYRETERLFKIIVLTYKKLLCFSALLLIISVITNTWLPILGFIIILLFIALLILSRNTLTFFAKLSAYTLFFTFFTIVYFSVYSKIGKTDQLAYVLHTDIPGLESIESKDVLLRGNTICITKNKTKKCFPNTRITYVEYAASVMIK